MFRTLRARLTLWNAVVVFIMVLVTLIGVRAGLRIIVRHNMDDFVIEEMGEIRRILRQLGPTSETAYTVLNRKTVEHIRRGMFVQIARMDGTSQWRSRHCPTIPIRRQDVVLERPMTIGAYRVVHDTLLPEPKANLIIQVGVATHYYDRDLEQFTNIMLAAGALVLLFSPLGGYLLAGRATQPLAEIIATTAHLNPANIEQRLPVTSAGDELDQLSVTINELLNRISAYVNQNREFTANAAHELRSPLAAIQNTLEVALNTDRSIDEYKEILSAILEQGEHLRMLTNQLLILAENDAGKLQRDGGLVRFDQVVLKAVEMFQGVAEVAEVQLYISCIEPLQVRGHAGRLRQVIGNLIDNAIKFNRANGAATVSLYLNEPTAEAILTVTDTGIGIAAGDLPHVFDRFYRSDKARNREEFPQGSGLGLSICQSIVAAHGGSISVKSTPGAGAAFTVKLPQAGPAPGLGQIGGRGATQPRQAGLRA